MSKVRRLPKPTVARYARVIRDAQGEDVDSGGREGCVNTVHRLASQGNFSKSFVLYRKYSEVKFRNETLLHLQPVGSWVFLALILMLPEGTEAEALGQHQAPKGPEISMSPRAGGVIHSYLDGVVALADQPRNQSEYLAELFKKYVILV